MASPFELNTGLIELGGVNSFVGTLTSRTLMFPELSAVLDADDSGNLEAYRHLVVEDNICGKQSLTTRQKTFRHLRELYALDQRTPLFAIWHTLWRAAAEERPLLALLLASTREPLLRITAPVILQALPQTPFSAEDFAKAIAEAIPGHYRPTTLAKLGRNLASAWTQSGHLQGRAVKARAKAVSGPASTAFAFLLAHLSEARGLMMFESSWVRLLDVGNGQLDTSVFAARSRGWIDYRRIGDVVDVSFSNWDRILAKSNESL